MKEREREKELVSFNSQLRLFFSIQTKITLKIKRRKLSRIDLLKSQIYCLNFCRKNQLGVSKKTILKVVYLITHYRPLFLCFRVSNTTQLPIWEFKIM